MAKILEVPTLDQLEALAEKAAFGDNAALDELGRLNERLGRTANKRMRRLEASGKTGDAYKRIANTVGKTRPRFSQAKTGSAESLFESAKTAAAALRQKETTLTGIFEVDMKTVDSVLEAFGKNPDAYTKQQKQNIADFLKTDGWKDLRAQYGSKALDAVTDAALNDDFENAILAFSEYESNMDDTDIIELSEEYLGLEW